MTAKTKWPADKVRQTFLDYFAHRDRGSHRIVPSSSLVPANDPTLLFINAGMNQFKDVFLGLEKRDYKRAVSSQKCVRAGGKHNDLENVGFTNRHHTFFEMLGNFSFGDYFKKEAIEYAWELVTSPDWYGIDKDKLWVTIFEGDKGTPRDDEAEKHWLDVGVPKDRILACGAKDNFWQMGETGPCGPCSEIHYDMGAKASDNEGHRENGCEFSCECGRYVEIWNLVFMQFDRHNLCGKESFEVTPEEPKGHEHKKDCFKLEPLPKPSIDTGAGLERLTAVLQGKISNYDTDLFTPLIQRAGELTGTKYGTAPKTDASLRIIADHARSATFLISDGVVPDKDGRGYVLRKIMRRAIEYGRQLGLEKPFLYKLAGQVRETMCGPFPELLESVGRPDAVMLQEEEKYARVVVPAVERMLSAIQGPRRLIAQAIDAHHAQLLKLVRSPGKNFQRDFREALDRQHNRFLDAAHDPGKNFKEKMKQILDAYHDRLLSAAKIATRGVQKRKRQNIETILEQAKREFEALTSGITGKELFLGYDSLGLRPDFMRDLLKEHGWRMSVDAEEEFQVELEGQRERARASWKGGAPKTDIPAYLEMSMLVGKLSVVEDYRRTTWDACEILAIMRDGKQGRELRPGEEGEVVLDHTPFYAESGGQVGDVGWLYDRGHNAVLAEVRDCTTPIQGVCVHHVIARQTLAVGDEVDAVVDAGIRADTMRNHTATHLLHSALRETLGTHVKQAGSLVDPGHLRFDFSHFTDVADEELQDIEDLINRQVLDNTEVKTFPDVPIDEAVNKYKAMALFGEKYGDRVRVVRIGDFSTELCGGTHVARTGEIGLVKLISESSVAAGTRRVEAISGPASLKRFRQRERTSSELSRILQTEEGKLEEAAEALVSKTRQASKELEKSRTRDVLGQSDSLLESAKTVSDVKVIAAVIESSDRGALRPLVDNLRQRLGSGVVVLGALVDGKVALVAGVTKDLTKKLPAGKIIKEVAALVGAKGGGRPDLAEAGGGDPARLPSAIGQAAEIIEKML